jgi:hypothetical protein
MKRIMRRFAIDEISAVDKPAQEGARAVIMKRDEKTGAAVAVHRQRNSGMDYSKTDRGALAMLALEGLAKALREREPHLSPEQAFSRVFADPANRIAAKAERESSRARLIAGAPVARTSAQVLNNLSDDTIHALIDEIRRDNPVLDDAGIVRLLVQNIGERCEVRWANRAPWHTLIRFSISPWAESGRRIRVNKGAPVGVE